MGVKVALPKGRLMAATAELLDNANWQVEGYHEKARLYHLNSKRFPHLKAKILQEKDIPIQVAVGNYDLGICGLDWVEELLSSYPHSGLVKLIDLGYGEGSLLMASAQEKEGLLHRPQALRLASEYPNLTQAWAVRKRLRHFCVFPLWGAAEAYPPENADLILLPDDRAQGLISWGRVVGRRATLVANRESLRTKDMAALLASLSNAHPTSSPTVEETAQAKAIPIQRVEGDHIRLALPDGHQQVHVARILKRAGIEVDDYPSTRGNHRPQLSLKGVKAKVIRPQDMPIQVANNYFDLAITGRDWLTERQCQFPSLPVVELADLRYGWVRIVAAIDNAVPATNISELTSLYQRLERPLRVASEYTHIADRYARGHHLGLYRLIPTWGASEAFIPDDADLLIENTETGGTLARHNLKIIDTLFESTACIIGGRESLANPQRRGQIMNIVHQLEGAVA